MSPRRWCFVIEPLTSRTRMRSLGPTAAAMNQALV
eukprot:CAMPEP_0171077134 /NCGR_PEP_ID=MMETSP0766_2-20121228/13845_1 /TAXON_ID=439317 /ORGANISM="Gambierdiscus australes, Strain CAWD 149" /LENGTH=34 /DNA_ID= /DNA_START= /DNA_END= /DNA_ORIENTATION=